MTAQNPMFSHRKQSIGFTLIELIAVIIIMGIIGAIVTPKFFNSTDFKARGFADHVLATLRYAQKAAIAQHRLVCVDLNSTTSKLTLTIANLSSDTSCGATVLNLPDSTDNSLTAPSGVSFSPTSTVNFNALGQANAATEITISSITAHIFIEAETGYVHQ